MDFYIDGVKTHSITRRADKPLEREIHLNMVTETYNWRTPPTPQELANDANTATYYDYVRGMQLLDIDADAPTGGSPNGNLVKNPGFETGNFTDWIGWGGTVRYGGRSRSSEAQRQSFAGRVGKCWKEHS